MSLLQFPPLISLRLEQARSSPPILVRQSLLP